ncbi:MAG: hypothetical protein EZS28_021685 [Streblomastix strix]|uniref:Uncharacterized protein n=1 Tax=Streblomastix strix TaxID=222440 RepID=A0A5J4VJN5_9EUKA|nr:MAG: hypothetical protein EZS28_021685 [Streblomastix strix]
MPTVLALPLANILSFVDTMQKHFNTTANVAYRAMGLVRLYCSTTNNYITSIEPKQFGAQNGLAVRYLFEQVFMASLTQRLQAITSRHYTLTAGAQDLYDGLSENGANQMLIISVSNQLQGITLQSIGGNGKISSFITEHVARRNAYEQRLQQARLQRYQIQRTVDRNDQYEQDLQEYRREQDQQEADIFWTDYQRQQAEEAKRIMNEEHDLMLLLESKKFTKPENFKEIQEHFILPLYFTSQQQNKEIYDKIRKNAEENIIQIENETETLLLFPPIDNEKFDQQNIHFYDDEHKVYYLDDIIKYVDEEPEDETNESDIQTVDILIVQEDIGGKLAQHAFAVANKEALTGLKFCPFCKSKGFDTKCPHFLRDYEKHTKKCEQNDGKIVKNVQLDQIAKPFCPHITQNKTYQYLLAHGRQKEFKPTQYYITYDLETMEKIVNKQFGKSSKQISELVPLSVASTIKNKQGIHTIYSDLRNGDDFITQWLKQVFEEAVIIYQDNQYFTPAGTIDKNMQYNVEVPVIGFNSSKFDFSLIFRNLQCADWEIKNYIGSSGIAKQIVVQHKRLDVKLKFIDVLSYYVPITLKEFAQTFNSEINGQKGVFPYEFINIDNYKEILNQSEPFPIEAFKSTLKNTSMKQEKYDQYVQDAKLFKNRWDYLQYYNEQDTKIMIERIDAFIQTYIKFVIDMLSFMSMAACANANKYAHAYKEFNVNDNKCVICGDEFTLNNKPTLDRIDNKKGHSKDNVQPCCKAQLVDCLT